MPPVTAGPRARRANAGAFSRARPPAGNHAGPAARTSLPPGTPSAKPFAAVRRSDTWRRGLGPPREEADMTEGVVAAGVPQRVCAAVLQGLGVDGATPSPPTATGLPVRAAHAVAPARGRPARGAAAGAVGVRVSRLLRRLRARIDRCAGLPVSRARRGGAQADVVRGRRGGGRADAGTGDDHHRVPAPGLEAGTTAPRPLVRRRAGPSRPWRRDGGAAPRTPSTSCALTPSAPERRRRTSPPTSSRTRPASRGRAAPEARGHAGNGGVISGPAPTDAPAPPRYEAGSVWRFSRARRHWRAGPPRRPGRRYVRATTASGRRPQRSARAPRAEPR